MVTRATTNSVTPTRSTNIHRGLVRDGIIVGLADPIARDNTAHETPGIGRLTQ